GVQGVGRPARSPRLRFRERERSGVGLHAVPLVGERVLKELAAAQAVHGELPPAGCSVERHVDVLLDETRAYVVDDHGARRPAVRLEPDEGLRRAHVVHTLPEVAGRRRGWWWRWWWRSGRTVGLELVDARRVVRRLRGRGDVEPDEARVRRIHVVRSDA